MSLSQRRPNVRWHVVRSFRCVMIERRILLDQAIEKFFQIVAYVGIGSFLDEDRRRSMPAEHGQQTGPDGLPAEPSANLSGNLDQFLPLSPYLDHMLDLTHDTPSLTATSPLPTSSTAARRPPRSPPGRWTCSPRGWCQAQPSPYPGTAPACHLPSETRSSRNGRYSSTSASRAQVLSLENQQAIAWASR
jgi:hypothetical protein